MNTRKPCRSCGTRVRRQRGGEYRPKGMINRGSGRIDPTSPERLPVDDVPAILGKGEFVVQKNAVDAVGEEFLNKINNIGLNNNKPKTKEFNLDQYKSDKLTLDYLNKKLLNEVKK